MARKGVGPQDNAPEQIFVLSRKVELPDGDLLHALVTTQERFLNELVGKNPGRWGSLEAHLKEQVVMIIAEAVELLNWLPWKKHKQSYDRALTTEERDAALEEAVDLLHFVFNCFILLGVHSGVEVYRFYMAKHGVNKKRQREGY